MTAEHARLWDDFRVADDGNNFTPAAIRAQQSVPPGSPITLVAGPHDYQCLDTIPVFRGLAIVSGHDGWIFQQNTNTYSTAQATVRFPNHVPGFRCYSPGEYSAETVAGSQLSLRHIDVVGAGLSKGTDGLANHGIFAHSRPVLEGCTIRNFGGCGIFIRGQVQDLPPTNANLPQAQHVRLVGNGSYGLYLEGGDANQGTFLALDLVGNCSMQATNKAQVYDNSFLGNLYIGCHSNTAGSGTITSFRNATSGNNRSQLMHWYGEGSDELELSHPGIAYGGWTQLSATSTGAHLYMNQGVLTSARSFAASNTRDGSKVVTGRLGSAATGGVAFELQQQGELPMQVTSVTIGGFPWWSWLYGGVNASNPMRVRRDGQDIMFPLGMQVGGINGPAMPFRTETRGGINVLVWCGRAHGFAADKPSSGTWSVDDTIERTPAAIGQPIGWRCVTAGTPGTWGSMGALA